MDNDLISRSALLDCIGDVGNDPEDDTTFLTIGQACAIDHKSIVDMVKAAPAVDAVEVVRCKDCKHGIWDDYEAMWQCVESADYDPELSMYHGFIIYEDADFYCKRGERREDDEL